MTGWQRFFQWVTIILLLAAIYLFFTLIQAMDRCHLSNMKLIAALEKRTVPPSNLPEVQTTGKRAANSGYFDRQARVGGKLTSALSADAPNINPLTVNEATASTIFSLCSATLAERDWQNPEIFKPMLAESWEISDDHLLYKIKLRRNARWQPYICPDSGKSVPAR